MKLFCIVSVSNFYNPPGKGRFSCALKQSVYDGDWVHDQQHGQGVIRFSNTRPKLSSQQWISQHFIDRPPEDMEPCDVCEGRWEHDLRKGHNLYRYAQRMVEGVLLPHQIYQGGFIELFE